MDLKESKDASFRHPWELTRLMIVESILGNGHSKNLLDIGCGDAFILKSLQHNKQWSSFGVDKNATSSDPKIFTDLKNINTKFDVVLLMDVLEHVSDDKEFFEKAASKIKLGGLCLITVPAYQFLFSEHDVFLEHYRRYTLENLKAAIPLSNFQILKCHYFYLSLFLVRLIQVSFKSSSMSKVTTWSEPEKSLKTKLIKTILFLDYKVCSILSVIGVPLPGLSCLILLKKIK